MNSEFQFIRRSVKPTEPKEGYFYWIDNGMPEEVQIWFAPSANPDEMILLNDKEIGGDAFDALVERVTVAENKYEDIINIIIDDEEVVAEALNDLNSRLLKIEEAGVDVELTDSDYDKIAEKVNERTLTLTWKAI